MERRKGSRQECGTGIFSAHARPTPETWILQPPTRERTIWGAGKSVRGAPACCWSKNSLRTRSKKDNGTLLPSSLLQGGRAQCEWRLPQLRASPIRASEGIGSARPPQLSGTPAGKATSFLPHTERCEISMAKETGRSWDGNSEHTEGTPQQRALVSTKHLAESTKRPSHEPTEMCDL